MQKKHTLVVTSIAGDDNPVLRKIAGDCYRLGVDFLVVGDRKSPLRFALEGCDFWSLERQSHLPFALASRLPCGTYARKNIGYLLAMWQGAEVIVETDDDNYPTDDFWVEREREVAAEVVRQPGWVNVYRYFTAEQIWPRGFPLESLQNGCLSPLESPAEQEAPIQQGLADCDPDVDAVYRMIRSSPVVFDRRTPIVLRDHAWCPFNSQNTTWFPEAFLLLYLPSHCSFRMIDIWRSFVAQRIAWTCGWGVLFHSATVKQERNEHDLLHDFTEEIPGYLHNTAIAEQLADLPLAPGRENICQNLRTCYEALVRHGHVDRKELPLVEAWISDCRTATLAA